jgi:hypothetical protein
MGEEPKKKDPKGKKKSDVITMVFSIFQEIFMKGGSSRVLALEYLYLSLLSLRESLNKAILIKTIDTLLLLFQKEKLNDHEVGAIREVCSIFTYNLISKLHRNLNLIFYDIVRHKIIEMNDVYAHRSPDSGAKSGSSRETSLFHHEITFLLRTLISLLYFAGSTIRTKISKPEEIYSIISPFLSIPHDYVRIATGVVLKRAAEVNSQQKFYYLSLVYNMVTILHAEVAHLCDSSLDKKLKDLHGNTVALASLLKETDFNKEGLPLDIASSIFETSKSKEISPLCILSLL